MHTNTCSSIKSQGWTPSEATAHINILKLQAVVLHYNTLHLLVQKYNTLFCVKIFDNAIFDEKIEVWLGPHFYHKFQSAS